MHLPCQRGFLSLFCIALLGLGWPATGQTEENETNTQKLIDSNTAFTLDLYSRLRSGDGNIFFSPYSISTALAMTSSGARDQTARQMADVLHFSMDPAQVHSSFATNQQRLNDIQKKGEAKLSIVNALWADQKFHFLDSFVQLARQQYSADVKSIDFETDSEKARLEINAWVAGETHDKIKDLIGKGMLDANTRLILTNAIYFKGTWEDKFDTALTQPGSFAIDSEKRADIPMMHGTGFYKYMENDSLQALQIGYLGGDLSMIILLPKSADLNSLEGSLNPENLKAWVDLLKPEDVAVSLPKFRLTGRFDLKESLSAMGMTAPFDPSQADFSGMDGSRDLYISAVIHQAFVDVTEEGTEAAAATAVSISQSLARAGPPPKIFNADHPFIFLIRDNFLGNILFLGRVVNPSN